MKKKKIDVCGVWQHAVAFVNGEQYYGAKASINVWTPRVTDQYEFSLSQLWVISGSFGNDLNTIEAGWQVCTFISNTFSKSYVHYFITFLLKDMIVESNFVYSAFLKSLD